MPTTAEPRSSVGTSNAAAEQWNTRSHVSIFVRCLHLLDLDLRDDWPAITEKTFSTRSFQQNIQHRVRAVEWSLFRLFELYSPREAQDKLRPFFPPSTSLQSLNLRAALLRSLTELKRNNVLGKDLVIRKTMLDECKGDRFEELLSSFAMAVLKSSVKTQAKGITASPLPSLDHDRTRQYSLPLVLAQRVSLRSFLIMRRQVRETAATNFQAFAEESVHLSERKVRALRTPGAWETSDAKAAVDMFRATFSADSRWIRIFLYGEDPETDISTATGQEKPPMAITVLGDQSLIASLDENLQKHEKQLSQWQSFRRSIPNKDSRIPVSAIPTSPSLFLLFDKHQKVKPVTHTDDAHQSVQGKQELEPSYHQLLQHMEEELGPGRGPAAQVAMHSAPCSSAYSRRLTLATDTPAPDAMGKWPQSIVASTAPSNFPRHTRDSVLNPTAEIEWLSKIVLAEGMDDSGLPRLVGSPSHRNDSFSRSKGDLAAEVRDPQRQTPERWITSPEDRNQLKVMGASAREAEEDRGATLDSQTQLLSIERSQTAETRSPDHQPLPILLERTRRSMALVPSAPVAKRVKQKSAAMRVSQFPVNQFETPRKQSPCEAQLFPASNSSTPREKLFSDDADYTSVFKTRTKIAVSPLISPERSLLDDSILHSRLGALALEESDG